MHDPDAFAELYEREAETVLLFVTRRTLDAEVALDITAERPVRVVVAGLLGDGVRSARLLGAGAARPLRLGRHGTFLVVLEPRYAGRPMRLRQVRADGRARTSSPSEPGGGCKPRPGSSVRRAAAHLSDGRSVTKTVSVTPFLISAGPFAGPRRGG
jgi:hypothetical protein